jgi:hypothetical protein
MASGIHFSLFGSFVFGTPEFPVSEVPLQKIVDRVADGRAQVTLVPAPDKKGGIAEVSER